MGITAERLHKLGLVDEVIAEPLGGAHRDPKAMTDSMRNALIHTLTDLQTLPLAVLLEQRQQKLAAYGVFKGT